MRTSRIGSSRRRHRLGAENLASETFFLYTKSISRVEMLGFLFGVACVAEKFINRVFQDYKIIRQMEQS